MASAGLPRPGIRGGRQPPPPPRSPLWAAGSRVGQDGAGSPLSSLGRMELWSLLSLACLALSRAAPPPSGRQVARMAQLSADFGLRVFREASKASKDQNLAFSPHGVASVVAMLQVASDGNTRRQIKDAMRFSLKGEGRQEGRAWMPCVVGHHFTSLLFALWEKGDGGGQPSRAPDLPTCAAWKHEQVG